MLVDFRGDFLELHGINEDLEAAHSCLDLVLCHDLEVISLIEVCKLARLAPERQQLLIQRHRRSDLLVLDYVCCGPGLRFGRVADLFDAHLRLVWLLDLGDPKLGILAHNMPAGCRSGTEGPDAS